MKNDQTYSSESEDNTAGLITTQNQSQEDIPALVNFILAYQLELNKLPKLTNDHRPRFLDAQ